MSLFLCCLIILSCTQKLDKNRKEQLWIMMKSNNVNSIVKAVMEIKEAKDTSMIDAILYKPNDPRITHNLLHTGMSVYQIKMTALKQITNIAPPKEITYEVDTTVINFYVKRFKR